MLVLAPLVGLSLLAGVVVADLLASLLPSQQWLCIQWAAFSGMLLCILLPKVLAGSSAEVARDTPSPQAEVEGLRKCEERLARAQALAQLGSWDWDLGTGQQHWSDELYRVFGLAPQERGASYEAFLGFVHPEDRAHLENVVEEAVSGRTPYRICHRIVRPDGSVRLVHQVGAVLREAERPVCMSGTVQDVTEHLPWVEGLLTSEERLRTLVDASPDPIYLKDGEGRWLKCNDAGLEVFRLRREGYQGKTDLELAELSGFYREALRFCYFTDQRAWERGTLARGEERVPQPDGSLRYFDVTKVPLFHPDGRRKSLVVLGRDITERKRAEQERDRHLSREQALARIGQALVSEVELERIAEVVIAQSRQLLGADGVGVWLAHLEGQELTLLASYGLSEVTVESLRHLSFDSPSLTAQAARTDQLQVIEDSAAPGMPIHHSLLSTEQQARGLVSVPLRVDGRLEGVMTYYTQGPRPLSLWDLEFHTAVGHLFAVALQKARLFQELREALRLREEFMSAAAHELKTPVTVIQSCAQLLLQKQPLTAPQQKGLTAIIQHTRRMARLVEQLLAAVQMAPVHPKLECQRFDLRVLLEEVVERIARTSKNPIGTEAVPPLEVVADRRLIGEAVGHLLENAIRYSGPGQPIEVEARLDDGRVRVAVRDHGPGIPPERQRHVFEPFYEPVPPGASGYTGVVSLGLYLSRRIVEAHRGRISVQSTPGEGAIFSLSLPKPGPEGGLSGEERTM